MAPKGGKGGSSGSFSFGGSSNACPNAFSIGGRWQIPIFVIDCLFFLGIIVLLILTGSWKKKAPHMKKVANWVYVTVLWLYLIAYGLLIIATMLSQCETIDYREYYWIAIPWTTINSVATFLFIYIVLVVTNTALRNAHGHNPSFLKIVYGFFMGILFVLMVTYVILNSLRLASQASRGYGRYRFQRTSAEVLLAESVFELLAFATAAVGVITSATQLRQRMRTGSLSPWSFALAISIIISAVFVLALSSSTVSYYRTGKDFSNDVNVAFQYIISISLFIALLSILGIAKNEVLSAAHQPPFTPANDANNGLRPPFVQQSAPGYAPVAPNTIPHQQQYAYVQQQPQMQQYQQTPYQQQQQAYAYAQPVQPVQPVQNHNAVELKTQSNAAELKS